MNSIRIWMSGSNYLTGFFDDAVLVHTVESKIMLPPEVMNAWIVKRILPSYRIA
jgi:hypothetical protein